MKLILSILLFCCTKTAFSGSKYVDERKLEYCEPYHIKSFPIHFVQEYSYRTNIAHKESPDIPTMLKEINETKFEKMERVYVKEPGYYLDMKCFYNELSYPVTILGYHKFVVSGSVYKLKDGRMAEIEAETSVGRTITYTLDPGRNLFFTISTNLYSGDFETKWINYFDIDSYLKHTGFQKSVKAAFVGYLLVSLLFSLFLILSFRLEYLIYYFLYLVALSYFALCWTGFYIDNNFNYLSISAGAMGIFLLMFGQYFVTSKGSYTFKVFRALILIQIINLLWVFLAKGIGLSGILTTLSLIVFICSSLFTKKRNDIPVRILLIGSISILVAAIVQSLNVYLQLSLPFTDGIMYYATFFETSCCTLAMILKIKTSERKAMTSSMHAFNQLSKVVYPHQIAQIKNNVNLEDTMPVSQAEACVISFDIIGSSKIRHVLAKDFFRNVFRRCNEIMMENYDESSLTSNAYRIKEMGDGFLCSVGYPFKSPSHNIVDDALKLCYRFSQALADESKILQPKEPICCGIGIALDSIQGFYPESGTKEYDLFGRAIILATRYENLRKVLLTDQKPHSILIVQERVHDSMDAEQRDAFEEIDLTEKHLVVRDDPAATKVYVRYLDHSSPEELEKNRALKASA